MKKLIQNHKGGILTDRKNLKKREKDFCREYVYCGNPGEAAQRAGYTVFPEMCGIRLLTERRIKEEIAELEGKLAGKKVALFGSYGWGGSYMQDWEARVKDAGAKLVADGVLALGAPDDEAVAKLAAAGKLLAE